MAAPAGDGKPSNVALELPLSEDIVPKPDPLHQITLRVTESHDRQRFAGTARDQHLVRDRFDLGPSSRRKADLRRMTEVEPLLGIIHPEFETPSGIVPALVDP